MENRFVIDSVAFINYFNDFFGEQDQLSSLTRKKINKCFANVGLSYKLVIPSIVLIEVFRKFLVTEEIVRKFYYEVYSIVSECENIEIKPIEQEVLEVFQNLNDFPMEHHDRLIYSSAIQLNAILITKDPIILNYNRKRNLIPEIIF